MIRLRYWIKHFVARRALRGYPLYNVPHQRVERAMTEAHVQENFDYFMNVRLSRLSHFIDWMSEHFAVRVTLDGDGLVAVSNWADEYGGGLIRSHSNGALNAWATYEPIWNDLNAGFNVMIDIGIFHGEYLIARRPHLSWEIYRGREIEPATFESIQFMKPCLGGFSTLLDWISTDGWRWGPHKCTWSCNSRRSRVAQQVVDPRRAEESPSFKYR